MINKNDLKDLIYNGASLDKQLNNITVNNGYMVSLLGYEKTFTPDDTNGIYNAVIEYQKKIKNNEYIGLWYNDGLVYVDISKHYTSKQKAILTGVKNRQYTIYDLKNKHDIDLLKTTYIVYKYDNIKNDLIYIKEYYNIKDLTSDYNLKNDRSVQHYICKNIETINPETTQLLNDRFIIVKDNIYIRDYMELLEA